MQQEFLENGIWGMKRNTGPIIADFKRFISMAAAASDREPIFLITIMSILFFIIMEMLLRPTSIVQTCFLKEPCPGLMNKEKRANHFLYIFQLM